MAKSESYNYELSYRGYYSKLPKIKHNITVFSKQSRKMLKSSLDFWQLCLLHEEIDNLDLLGFAICF